MRFIFLCSFISIALLSIAGCEDAGVEPVFDTPMYFKGYAYTSFASDGFRQGVGRSAVSALRAQTGSTWVALTLFEFQSSAHSFDIAPNTTGINPVTHGAWYASSTLDDIRIAVRDARSASMRVMLKPHVDCYSGEWRALISPDAGGAWFAAYTSMMLKYAQLAAEEHIEMLCIGTELITATGPRYTNEWKSLISRIRSVYGGMLTYSSNWSGFFSSEQGEYEQIGFWGELDYLGVSAYFPLTQSRLETLPSEAAAEARVHAHGVRLSAAAVRWGKQVLLTEAGCQSVEGALSNPADYTFGAAAGAVRNDSVQACYYASVLNYFGNRPWCAGMFWWNWDTAPSPYEATDYTCRNKLAASILKRFYSGQPPAAERGYFADTRR